ncbi:MAG: NAD(+)/NADH kinase [Calditrichota bacterium]
MKLGLMGNLTKPNFREVLSSVVEDLRKRKFSFVVEEAAAEGLGLDASYIKPAAQIADVATIILSFGGDGTLLRTASIVGARPVPILGINLGPGLGYLTEVTVSDIPAALDRLLTGRFLIEQRMRICASAEPDPAIICDALNDIVIGHSRDFRTMQIEVMIDGKPVTTYRCDGLIIATPTGSTAYTLSAGGPIIEPTLQVMIVTPICPHTLTMRPVVISAHRTVEVKLDDDAHLAADGETIRPLSSGEIIRVSRSTHTTSIANVTNHDFYRVLRAKLQWGQARFEPLT